MPDSYKSTEDPQTMTQHASNGTFQKEEHNGEVNVDVAEDSPDNTESWHVFSHTISVKMGFPGSESWSQEDGHRAEVSSDTFELEEEIQPQQNGHRAEVSSGTLELEEETDKPSVDANHQQETMHRTIILAEDKNGHQHINSPAQQPVLLRPKHERRSYPTDLTDAQWLKIAPLLPPSTADGHQHHVELREVVNGILYAVSAGHSWGSLPRDLPPRGTVYSYFKRWQTGGALQQMFAALSLEESAAAAHARQDSFDAVSGHPAAEDAAPAGLLAVEVILEETTALPDVSEHQDVSHPLLSTLHDLSVVVPTRNEQDNIRPLLESLREALRDLRVEVIFVDDSDDETPAVITEASRTLSSSQFQIHLEHRVAGEARAGGLATAVVRGMNRAQAEFVAVIDADLQHPPELLRTFYDQAVAQDADLVLASRYIKGGSYRGLASVGRRAISKGLKWTAKVLFPGQLLRISDPLGGFFLLRRSLLANVSLRPIGYKILLEILIRCQWRQVLEVPYHFQARAAGQSKANMQQGIQVLQHMQRLWREVPAAGRVWKISFLILVNVSITLLLLLVNKSFPLLWTNLNIVVFALTACLDFVLFNRFIFPLPIATSSAAPSSSSLISIDVIEEVLKEDVLPSDQNGATNGYHPSSKDLIRADLEKDVLPSTQNGATNGHHPPSIDVIEEDLGQDELPSKELVVSSAVDLIRNSQPPRKKFSYDKFQSLAVVVVIILAVCWISYTQPGALLVLAVLLIGFAIVITKNVNRDQAITMVLAVAVGVASIDYISWRIVATNWHGWWIAVPLLCAEFFGALHVLGYQFTIWPRPPVEIEQGKDPTQYPIFVFIPTVNEGAAILRQTLEGIIAARAKYLAKYPHGRVTIVVCNDGRVAKTSNWEEIDRLAKELGVCCVTRTEGGGAKAGNIENARRELQATGDALLVIFDADQVAKPDFLLKTIPPFRDLKMGWVQTGQYYANLDNPVSRWADDQQSMFYNLLCPGKEALNAAFICGTNVVIRASALDEIGGLPQDSVTEDFKASIALHPSWRSIYLTDILATGLGPLDIPSYLKQQGRWALGTLGVFRSHWREILLPRKHGLQIGQRVQYFLACTHYLCGLRDLIYMVSPILFIFTGIPAVRSAYLSEYLWHFIPYGVLGAVALWYSARGVTGLRGIIIGFGSFPVLIGSLLSVVLQRKVGFAVTSKQHSGKRSLSYLRIYFFFLLLCVDCLFWATRVKGQQETALFISVLWVVYSMLMLGSFLWLNLKDRRFQTALQQSGATDEIIAKHPYPSKLLLRPRGLHSVLNLGFAALIAVPILASSSQGILSFLVQSEATPFVISQDKIAAPYFGVSLPIQLLKSRPQVLEHDLDTQFSIIGRTQDIHDLFDASWADQLAAQHARPWITLQFGVFGPNQKPPLDANLPAIINGLHDNEIRRWAGDIREYGKPVYLTVFQHADKNWSLSSGVANGGIPQDVPKAWMHVQSIFRAVGANNVAWVWAPADPINDQAYAP
ncbi:MAG TPA: glycosyltransferase, partial [Ktedonobacteraceae bacterium]|nr:glycosyltransferase [Ktedonobacteraceae bacterium]